MTYTQLALIGVAATVLLDFLVLRTKVLRTRAFWVSYAIVLFFQLVTNGVLTGFRIVRYDETAILGTRIAFAPVEDLLFGFSLVVQTISWWVFWGRRLSGPDARATKLDRPPQVGDEPGPTRAR